MNRDTLILLALGLSAAANLGLSARLLLTPSKLPEPIPASGQVTAQAPRPHLPLPPAEPPGAPELTHPTPSFVWRDLEHEDYHQYIANLRAVGCPEPTIRDLIAADLSQQFASRAASVWQPAGGEYWQKFIYQEPSPAQVRELETIAREQSAVFQTLLGTPLDQQQSIDLIHLQLHGSEQQLLFLPEQQRNAAMRALADAEFEQRQRALHNRPPRNFQDSENALFKEKLGILSAVLSPAELEEFRLRHSPTAQRLRIEVQYFDLTPAEFKQLLDAREAVGSTIPTGDLLTRGPATEQIRQLFGEDRAREFEKVSDIYYQGARRAVDGASLPVEYAEDAWQISRDTRAAAEQLARDESLPLAERHRQLRELRSLAELQLNDLLGEKIARPLRRDLAVSFRVIEANLKP